MYAVQGRGLLYQIVLVSNLRLLITERPSVCQLYAYNSLWPKNIIHSILAQPKAEIGQVTRHSFKPSVNHIYSLVFKKHRSTTFVFHYLHLWKASNPILQPLASPTRPTNSSRCVSEIFFSFIHFAALSPCPHRSRTLHRPPTPHMSRGAGCSPRQTSFARLRISKAVSTL